MQTILVGSEFLAEDLDRDLAPQLHVLREIDLTHSAGAQLLENSVMGNFFLLHPVRLIRSKPSEGCTTQECPLNGSLK